MKKLIPFAIAVLLFIGCSKNSNQKTYCWQCTVTISYSGINTPDATSTTQQCDMTEDEIRKMEQAGTSTTTSSAGGVTVTMHTTTICQKMQ